MKNLPVDVCVIGGAGVDIFGSADDDIVPFDSNIGTITTSFGGVGRNIANNLCKLNLSVELVCALGTDDNGNLIADHCRTEKIGLSHCLKTTGRTAGYLSINQANGDIYTAIADMTINDELTPAFFGTKMAFINSCRLVVLETNLPQESIEFLLNNLTVPVYVDPVSVPKARKLLGRLSKIIGFKPNLPEAITLSGQQAPPHKLAETLLNFGIQEVYLTLGADGLYCANRQENYSLPIYPGPVVNTTGCGDAFLAGVIYGVLKGADFHRRSLYGLAGASIACRSLGSYSEQLTESELLKVTGENI